MGGEVHAKVPCLSRRREAHGLSTRLPVPVARVCLCADCTCFFGLSPKYAESGFCTRCPDPTSAFTTILQLACVVRENDQLSTWQYCCLTEDIGGVVAAAAASVAVVPLLLRGQLACIHLPCRMLEISYSSRLWPLAPIGTEIRCAYTPS